MTKYYTNGDIATKVEFIHVGYGTDAQKIFGKLVTTFSIAQGIIQFEKYIKPNCFWRY